MIGDLKVAGDGFEFAHHTAYELGFPIGCDLQAVIYVVPDQFLLCLRDRALNRIQLLRQIKARPTVRKHRYDPVKMPFGTPQALDDAGVRFVDRCCRFHGEARYSSEWTITRPA